MSETGSYEWYYRPEAHTVRITRDHRGAYSMDLLDGPGETADERRRLSSALRAASSMADPDSNFEAEE